MPEDRQAMRHLDLFSGIHRRLCVGCAMDGLGDGRVLRDRGFP